MKLKFMKKKMIHDEESKRLKKNRKQEYKYKYNNCKKYKKLD